MDLFSQSNQPTASAPSQQTARPKVPGHKRMRGGGMRVVSIVLLVSSALLLGLLALFLGTASSSNESKYVDESKFQAVFLNGGQVYFGKIRSLNSKYTTLDNIYYLRVNQQVQPNQDENSAQTDVSLAKLGCELHGPTDSMVINRDQIIFWENLKDDGQVVKAIAEFVKANPQGQKCADPAAATTDTTNDTNN